MEREQLIIWLQTVRNSSASIDKIAYEIIKGYETPETDLKEAEKEAERRWPTGNFLQGPYRRNHEAFIQGAKWQNEKTI